MFKENVDPSQNIRLVPYEVFDSSDQLALSLDSLICFFNKRYKASKGLRANIHGFIVQRIDVIFTDQVEDIKIEMQYASSCINILAPPPAKKTHMDIIRLKLLSEFFPLIPETQFRSTVQLWLTLKPKARLNLIKNYSMKGSK